MNPLPSSRSCHLREEVQAALTRCRQIYGSRKDFQMVIDSRLPEYFAVDSGEVAKQLDNLLDEAIRVPERKRLVLLVYEMDDTTRSALCFEIEGTRLKFTMAPEAAAPAVETGPLAILVVEDNLVNQHLAAECLRSLDQECEIAANGREAVEAAAKKVYDVIFMDVHMPEMDGLDATRLIRAAPKGDWPYIAALTAYAMPGDKAKCIEAGMNDYIAKPCRIGNLAAVLSKARERHRP